MTASDKNLILVLDLGSTSARAFVINTHNFDIIGSAKYEIKLSQSDHGECEINPEELFENLIKIIRESLRDARVDAENVLCLGITVQRATFILVNKATGEPFNQLISWSDRRANNIVEKMNSSFLMKCINGGATMLHFFTHKNRYKQGSNLKINNSWIAPRLSHILKNNPKLKEAMKEGRMALCTVDTWLLNKLKKHTKLECISEVSTASATGLFDAFDLDYIRLNLKVFGIERDALAMVVNNSHDFGFTHASVVGAPVRIAAIIADQAASLIGNACFNKMDAKITLGTGTFLNVNTGDKCKGSRNGAHPMIAWSIRLRGKESEKTDSTVYYTERQFNDSSTLIRFAKTVGLCTNVEELSDMAFSVTDSNGVTFIPKFYSTAGFIGFKQSTTKCHLVRAVLESIVFIVAQFYFLNQEEQPDFHYKKLRIDGGISANDFICQSIADLLNVRIERGKNSSEITSLGCAYLAAYNCGIFETLEHAEKFFEVEKVFTPIDSNHRELFKRFKRFCDINS